METFIADDGTNISVKTTVDHNNRKRPLKEEPDDDEYICASLYLCLVLFVPVTILIEFKRWIFRWTNVDLSGSFDPRRRPE